MSQRDKGVTPALLDRNFGASDDLFDSRLQLVPWSEATWRERKNKLMTAKEAVENLAAIQASRPLKPPGRR